MNVEDFIRGSDYNIADQSPEPYSNQIYDKAKIYKAYTSALSSLGLAKKDLGQQYLPPTVRTLPTRDTPNARVNAWRQLTQPSDHTEAE